MTVTGFSLDITMIKLDGRNTLVQAILVSWQHVLRQVVANTFGKGVTVHCISIDVNGNPLRTNSFFAPIVREPVNMEVIHMFLHHAHFLLVGPAKTKASRPVKIILPPINPYHKYILKLLPRFNDIDYSVMF
ncbi:hypothetical protein BDF21DRAFT_397780 [Thamnidium elegans]|nr:hypothetical protein BDF21DRAFT_397780 [Thamnidium elegans]